MYSGFHHMRLFSSRRKPLVRLSAWSRPIKYYLLRARADQNFPKIYPEASEIKFDAQIFYQTEAWNSVSLMNSMTLFAIHEVFSCGEP